MSTGMSKKPLASPAFSPLNLEPSQPSGADKDKSAHDMDRDMEALLEPSHELDLTLASREPSPPLKDAQTSSAQTLKAQSLKAQSLKAQSLKTQSLRAESLSGESQTPQGPKAQSRKRADRGAPAAASQGPGYFDLEPLVPPSAAPPSDGLTDLSAGAQPLRLPFWARFAYPAAIVLAVLWSAPLVAFCLAYQNHYGPFEYAPFPPVLFGALAMLPTVFMLLGSYVLRQAAKLSVETQRARAMADDLAIPAALAVDQAGGAVQAVRREVSRATQAGEAAERQLLSLRQSLADESDRLIAVTEAAERTARALSESLSRERSGMAELSSSLEQQVEAINQAIDRQTKLVAETSDLASVQLQEAQAALAARATDLAAAAGEAGEAAELAGEALTRQADRLEAVGDIVGERLQMIHEDLGRGHSRLADLAVQLQADQDALSSRLEAQRQSAVEVQASLIAVTGGTEEAATNLRDLIAEVDTRLRAVGEAATNEQAALDARARASLSLFRDAVADERDAIETLTQSAIANLAASAEETRRIAASDLEAAAASAAAQAEAARAQVELLGEAAYAAGQRADQAFEARISAARRAIEHSAALLEEAGLKSVGRIDEGLGAAKAALGEVDARLAALDQRVAAIPASARANLETVRAGVEASLAELSASARKLASDSEAMDTALQERVRRNYEMLSQALKTMDKAAAVTEQAAARAGGSGAAGPSASGAVRVPAATPPAQPSPRDPIIASGIASGFADGPLRSGGPASPAPSAPEPPLRPAALAAGEVGLRPRLRLTPEAEISPLRQTPTAERPAPITHPTLEPFVRPPAPAQRREAPSETQSWSWKDLLSSIDEPPIDDEVLAERLISEIEALGLDAAALLPLSQIDAIASAMQKGELERVREAVRALAPGAVRRLSRRVLTDKVLRAHADRYVRRYEDLLSDSARRDREGFMTAALLGSEPGRAFLLFDAAVGELH